MAFLCHDTTWKGGLLTQMTPPGSTPGWYSLVLSSLYDFVVHIIYGIINSRYYQSKYMFEPGGALCRCGDNYFQINSPQFLPNSSVGQHHFFTSGIRCYKFRTLFSVWSIKMAQGKLYK